MRYFPSRLPIKNSDVFLTAPLCATWPANLILYDRYHQINACIVVQIGLKVREGQVPRTPCSGSSVENYANSYNPCTRVY
jgi:hypothetical protein